MRSRARVPEAQSGNSLGGSVGAGVRGERGFLWGLVHAFWRLPRGIPLGGSAGAGVRGERGYLCGLVLALRRLEGELLGTPGRGRGVRRAGLPVGSRARVLEGQSGNSLGGSACAANAGSKPVVWSRGSPRLAMWSTGPQDASACVPPARSIPVVWGCGLGVSGSSNYLVVSEPRQAIDGSKTSGMRVLHRSRARASH